MTNEEIVRDYNAAKNKQKQVRILADLNQTSPSEILTILAEEGVEGVKRPEKIMPRKQKPESVRGPSLPAAPSTTRPAVPQSATVYDRIETILGAIPEDASKYMRNNAMNLVVSMFSYYVENRLGKEARDDA